MPKRILWTERIFKLVPIGKERGSFASFFAVRLIRSVCFVFILFLTGILVSSISGFPLGYDVRGVNSLAPFGYFFAVLFLVLVVSGWFHNKWDWFFGWSSHIVKLSETEFGKFRDRMEKFINSSFACLVIALILFVLVVIPGIPFFFDVIGSTVFVVWMLSVNSFVHVASWNPDLDYCLDVDYVLRYPSSPFES